MATSNASPSPSSPEQVTRASSIETIHPLTMKSANKYNDEPDPASSSDIPSDTSSDFDRVHHSLDIDDTPATFQDDLLSGRSDAGGSSMHKSNDSMFLSNTILPNNGGTTDAVTRVDELHEEIAALFDKFLPTFQDQQSDDDNLAEPTLPSRNLPALLTEFEKQRGHALIDPKVYTQLEVFIAENPEVPITSRVLVNLIHALESSAHSAMSDGLPPTLDPLSDKDTKSSRLVKEYEPAADIDGLSDASQDEYLIRDVDSSRDLSRELNPQNAVISDLREDLRLEREKSDALLQLLSDKERKVNNLENKLVTLQEQHEETMLEEQSKIEELSNQVQNLKKDEKESRIKLEEVQQLTTSYESELAALTLQLEAAGKANARLKRDMDDEADATLRIKEDLDRRLKESRELSVYLEECEAARDNAERNASQLKQDLEIAVADGARLQEYREEAEELRATADKLELELDEMRRVAARHNTDTALHQHSNPPTLQRRLGNELARRLEMQSESSGEDTQIDEKEDTDNVDDFIETVIQRRRRRVGKARTSLEYTAQAVQTEPAPVEPKTMAAEPVYEPQAVEASKPILPFGMLENRLVSILVLIFSIGMALGLIFNTSRDIYHINQLSLDAENFRRLNFLPNSSKPLYYDGKYPHAVVGSNVVDDYLAPVLDTVISLVRPVRTPRNSARRIYY